LFGTSMFGLRKFGALPKMTGAEYAGTGVLVVDGIVIEGLYINFTGTSSLTCSATFIANATADLTGTGIIEITGVRVQSTGASLAGEGIIIVDGVRRRFGEVVLTGEGLFETNGIRVLRTGVDFTGTGILAGRGIVASFLISEDNLLRPLNVFITGDSRKEILPSVQEYSERIPGRHGDIRFATKLEPRLLELHVVTKDGLTPAEREQLKRTLAGYLNPVAGYSPLIFADDLDKTYMVKYAGKISLEQVADGFEFFIPFKLGKPYITETFEQTLTGSGTITNAGNVEAYLTIEIHGVASGTTTVTVGDKTLTYTGDIATGETVVIDTEKWTVEKDSVNVLENYAGGFPKLAVGDTAVTAGSNVTFKWKGRWV
jgi:predicted phage tail component-like protein